MLENDLSVREIQADDIEALAQYWLGSENSFLTGMGVDINKLPTREQLHQMLLEQMHLPYHNKKSYCTIWQHEGIPIGHCNTNPSIFGEDAYMHLHLWDSKTRAKGLGVKLVKMSLPYFFENLQLNKLYSEPYSFNPAPNKALPKIGFKFVKEYLTTPGFINFEQLVNRWELTLDNFNEMNDKRQY